MLQNSGVGGFAFWVVVAAVGIPLAIFEGIKFGFLAGLAIVAISLVLGYCYEHYAGYP